MIDGQQISDARQRAGLTQQQLAERVGVSLRTVGNWERGETVPRAREHAIRSVLSDHLGGTADPGLRAASDAELLAEIARRFERAPRTKAGEGSDERPAPMTPAGESPATAFTLLDATADEGGYMLAASDRDADEESEAQQVDP